MADMRFTVAEITQVAQEVANSSDDGKVSVSEFTSALSRFVHQDETKKFRDDLGRDSFGRPVVKKVA